MSLSDLFNVIYTKMLQGVVFGVVLIVADVSMSTVHQHDNVLDLNDRDFITALIDEQRVKRATLTNMLEYHANAEARSRRALPSILEALFDGAKLLMKSGDYELFGKTGGYSQAKAEFELLGLKSVRTNSVGYGRAATVGDRTVILSRNAKGGTIDVWKNKLSPDGTRTPYRIKRIRYMD